MWNRIDLSLRRAIFHAAAIAEQNGDHDLTTLHLLKGLAHDPGSAAMQLLARAKITPEGLDRALAEIEPDETAVCAGREPGLTAECRRAVDRSYRLARDLGDEAVGGEHLLLAFVQEPTGCDAGRVLSGLGAGWSTLAAALMALQPHRIVATEGVDIPLQERRRVSGRVTAKVRKVGKAAILVLRYPQEPYLRYMVGRTRIVADPYPYYASLRKKPFRWDRMIGQWFVTGYKDVQAVLQEPRFSTQQYSLATRNETELPPLIDREFRSLDRSVGMHVLFLDAPKQTRIRSLVMKQFTPRVIARMEEQIQEITDSLLARAAGRGRLDVIADLAIPLPGLVIERMLGVSDLDSAVFKRWSDAYIAYIGSESSMALDLEAYEAYHSLQDYFRQAVALRRDQPRDDVLSLLMQARDGDDRLSDEEIIANSLLMLAVGRETTTQFIGNMVLALLRNPAQWERLRADPALMSSALEEILRYDSPVQWSVRIAREAFDWNGRRFEKGHVLNLAIGAANRDPAQFTNPDQLDIGRTENRHIAFGYGPHFCLGAALARLEGQVVLRTLLERYPKMTLGQESFTWRRNTTFRAVMSLEVSLNA